MLPWMAEELTVSVAGEGAVQAMTLRTHEPCPVRMSVHRDIICWMSSFVSHPDFASENHAMTHGAI